MKRAMLHKSKLDEFLKYLSDNEIPFRDGKGDYEVIQVCVGGRFYPIHRRHSGDHMTTQDALKPIIIKFIRDQKNAKTTK